MNIIGHLHGNFSNVNDLNNRFHQGIPDPIIVLDNFLPYNTALNLSAESDEVNAEYWTEFTRNNSYMQECTKLALMPEAYNLVSALHSQMFMQWLEEVTSIKGLIPDPLLIGGGYSKSWRGDSLKVHTDFNWNDQLRLHRALSLILYLTPDWKTEWGGSLDFYDHQNKELVTKVDCLFNRCIIWKYHKRGFHGYPSPLNCPESVHRTTFRLFYYQSNSEYDPNDRPHRSLYWYDNELHEPYDIPTQK